MSLPAGFSVSLLPGTPGNEDSLEADTRRATPTPGVAAPQVLEPSELGSSIRWAPCSFRGTFLPLQLLLTLTKWRTFQVNTFLSSPSSLLLLARIMIFLFQLTPFLFALGLTVPFPHGGPQLAPAKSYPRWQHRPPCYAGHLADGRLKL